MAFRTPSARSEVHTRLILVVGVSSLGTGEPDSVIGEVSSALRRQEGINDDSNASPPSDVIPFKNSRRFSSIPCVPVSDDPIRNTLSN